MTRKRLKQGISGFLFTVLSVGVFSGPASFAQSGSDGLFRSRERFVSDTSRHTKWTGMLQRFEEETLGAPPKPAEEDKGLTENAKDNGGAIIGRSLNDCAPERKAACRKEIWQGFIDSAAGMAGFDLLDAVNRFHNQTPYITDLVNWGVADYWETLGEYFLKDGDCEDYAISKYISLKRLGWPEEAMRIAVIRDENLRIPHAVLVVYEDGQRYVLDNQAPTILTDDRILHYRPVFSINETGWWHHVPKSFLKRFR